VRHAPQGEDEPRVNQPLRLQSQSHGLLTRPVEAHARFLERTHNLPSQLTSLIGRGEAIAELRGLLVSTRLLTLTGPGGVGKTRLALALGESLATDYEHGVWLVELASVTDHALIASAVAAGLGIYEGTGPVVDRLVEVLRSRAMLLVLDNCEHLVWSCAEFVDNLLRTCPDVQILATSRELLRIDGESVWRVPWQCQTVHCRLGS
jgi:non-specific serine/threonine protein kinase